MSKLQKLYMSIDIRAESRAIYLKDYFVSLRVDAPLSLSLAGIKRTWNKIIGRESNVARTHKYISLTPRE